MGIEFDLSGARDQMQRVSERAKAAIERHGDYQAQSMFADTQEKVPKATGRLAASGDVHKQDVIEEGKYEWEIHYGDSEQDRLAVFYAAAVEKIETHKHAPPTEAEYMRTTFDGAAPGWQRAIEDAMREATS